MESPAQKVVILTIGVVIMLIAGCSEQEMSKSDVKRSRLIAIENRQLKEQLEQRGKQIEEQKELLAKCLQEKKALEEYPQKDTRAWLDSLLEGVVRQNRNLTREKNSLKEQVEQLKKEVEELKAGPGLRPL